MTGEAVVRNRHGAVLGADYRQSPLSPVQVPGRVAVDVVMPGDGIRVGQDVLVVAEKRPSSLRRGLLLVTVLLHGGGEVVFEYEAGQYVEVVTVGNFDPEAVDRVEA